MNEFVLILSNSFNWCAEFVYYKKEVQKKLLSWYKKHKRNLPWRHTRDPYHILVSEVMLQQTQVDRVIFKYQEFLKKFPTTKKLAAASTADVIRAWQGLGYNRRALFLQKTAVAVEEKYKGKFPQSIEELKELPGIGDYTARAVLSFAFELPYPMMDTNHRRFYQRVFFGLDQKNDKELLVAAEQVIPKQPYDWNQALMDFGSIICLTSRPKCEICPLQKYCKAYPNILKEENQVKKKKTKPSVPFKQTDRYVRGRIVDLLREEHGVRSEQIYRLFAEEYGYDRVGNIIAGLVKDQLIIEKRGKIYLP